MKELKERANQKTFLVTEYYLNCQPPVELETKIKATSAVEAIRKIEHWKYAERFTHRVWENFNTDRKLQAYTQDGDGMSGCHAIILGET